MENRKGFTLIELMVVILIVSILAGVAIPLMQGRIDSAKWSEANACAGTIRTAVRAYVAQEGITQATSDLDGEAVSDHLEELGFDESDLKGSYFTASNYTISDIDADGLVEITVTAGTGLPADDEYVLGTDGSWTKQ
ncbi:MAG: type II secretion system protein [Phycisphaerae bacterium]|jgi:type IV pilus assembly protein PilA